ncbi:MAG: hypothetical protein WBE58_24840 [Verrucomicrobiales bacterium]|nr:hypothetical protein [Verrucomicrobiales bacterium]
MGTPFLLRILALRLALPILLFSSGVTGIGSAAAAEAFTEDSPEHQALLLASPFLERPAFTLREDYWQGGLSPELGHAVKLQFFKGNVYRLFMGIHTKKKPTGATLHLHIFNEKGDEVAHATSAGTQPFSAMLEYKSRKTGAYLILMRLETAPEDSKTDPKTGFPCVLFYGWE